MLVKTGVLCCCSCRVVIKEITQVVPSILAIRASFHHVTYRNTKHVTMLPTEAWGDYELIKAKQCFPANKQNAHTHPAPAKWQAVAVRLQSERMRNSSNSLPTFRAFPSTGARLPWTCWSDRGTKRGPLHQHRVRVWQSGCQCRLSAPQCEFNIPEQFTTAKMLQKNRINKVNSSFRCEIKPTLCLIDPPVSVLTSNSRWMTCSFNRCQIYGFKYTQIR